MNTSQSPRIFTDKETLARGLAGELVASLDSIQRGGRIAHVALSGGSTPTLLFRQLVKMDPGLDWQRVRIFWVDERCVPPDHAESNFRVAREEFLDPLGIPESAYFRMRGENDPEREAERYAGLLMGMLPKVEGIPVFDRILLGMGSDGHTASIFPHQADLWDADALCTVGTHPESGQKRVTLTGKVINAARVVTFMVTGKEKRDVLDRVFRSEGNYPASRVKPVHGRLQWYIDSDAAGHSA